MKRISMLVVTKSLASAVTRGKPTEPEDSAKSLIRRPSKLGRNVLCANEVTKFDVLVCCGVSNESAESEYAKSLVIQQGSSPWQLAQFAYIS